MAVVPLSRKDDEAYSVSTVERALGVLAVFSRTRTQMTLSDISAASGLHKATVFRLVTTLCRAGILSKDERTGLYAYGNRLIVMGEIAKAPPSFVGQARPFLRQLRDAVNETSYLSIRDGDLRIDIEQLEGLGRLRRDIVLGEPRPLHIGAPSKVLLAALADKEIDDYCRRIDLTLRNPDRSITAKKLWAELKTIREKGFASSINQIQNAAAASAPVTDATGAVVGAISVTAPMTNGTYIAHGQLIDAVVNIARALSRELGAQNHWD